jgi:FlaG/FlaF family flagellin (archaellin)
MDAGGWWSERSQGEKVAVAVGGAVCLVPALVGVVVVGAAVLGAFVLGTGEPPEAAQTPQVSFDFDATDDGRVTVTHQGGDSVPASELRVVVDGRSRAWPGSGRVVAGDSATVDAGAGATVRVVWSDGGERAVLGSYTVG